MKKTSEIFWAILGMVSVFAFNPYKDYSEVLEVDNKLVLVNRKYKLSNKYIPKELQEPNIRFSDNMLKEEKLMTKESGKALEELMLAAEKEEGIILYAISGYRCYNTQNNLYKHRVKILGREEADKYVAKAGHSEHQTGLAMDLTNREGLNKFSNDDFGKTTEGIWIRENAHRFGFIIRYPRNKEHITGYDYEPWHIRYVGKKAAEEIYNNNLVLEEYIK